MYVRYKGTAVELTRDGVDVKFHSFILGKVGQRVGAVERAIDHTGAAVECAFVDYPGLPLLWLFALADLEDAEASTGDPQGDARECILAMGEIMRDVHGAVDTDKVVTTTEIAKHLGWTIERVQSAMYTLAAAGLIGEQPEAKGSC